VNLFLQLLEQAVHYKNLSIMLAHPKICQAAPIAAAQLNGSNAMSYGGQP
jgi:hypothetical protein